MACLRGTWRGGREGRVLEMMLGHIKLGTLAEKLFNTPIPFATTYFYEVHIDV